VMSNLWKGAAIVGQWAERANDLLRAFTLLPSMYPPVFALAFVCVAFAFPESEDKS
jgi:hypothetical protein